MWPYSVHHNNTQYFIHRHGSATYTKYTYLMDADSHLEFNDTEAFVLT